MKKKDSSSRQTKVRLSVNGTYFSPMMLKSVA